MSLFVILCSILISVLLKHISFKIIVISHLTSLAPYGYFRWLYTLLFMQSFEILDIIEYVFFSVINIVLYCIVECSAECLYFIGYRYPDHP